MRVYQLTTTAVAADLLHLVASSMSNSSSSTTAPVSSDRSRRTLVVSACFHHLDIAFSIVTTAALFSAKGSSALAVISVILLVLERIVQVGDKLYCFLLTNCYSFDLSLSCSSCRKEPVLINGVKPCSLSCYWTISSRCGCLAARAQHAPRDYSERDIFTHCS